MKRIVLVIVLLAVVGLRAEQQPALYPVDKLNQEFGKPAGTPVKTANTGAAAEYRSKGAVIRANLNDKTWQLQDIRLADGTPVHNGFVEQYVFEFNDGRASVTVAETELKITGRRNYNAVVEIDAVSPKMPGVYWRKHYSQENPGSVNKKVTVWTDNNVPAFLIRVQTTASAAPPRDGAYIWSSPYGYFPAEAAALVKGTTPKQQPAYIFPVTVYPDLNKAVGVWLDKINGRTIHARETSIWNAKNGALESSMLGEFLGQGGKAQLEYEWIVQVTNGGALDLYREYQERAGYKALMGDLPDPDWMDHVRFAMDCGTMDLLGGGWTPGKPLKDLSHFQKWLNDDPLDAIVWSIFSWGTLGGMPTEGEWQIYEPRPMPMNAEAVRHMVQGLSADGGRIRAALYDWNHSFDPAQPPYNGPAHKSWAAWNADGSINSSWACTTFTKWWPKVDAKPNYLDPGYLSFYLGQMAKLPVVYGTRAVYIDAEVGQCYADWNTKTWFQPYDQYDFKKKYRLASGDNLPLIKNTPNSPYVSGGYWEGRGLVPAVEAEKNWRNIGAKILGDKIWQWEHRWTALLGGNRKDKQPNYSYYTIGLGFKPHANASIREYGLNRAAFDMRHSRLLANRFSPCYWRNDDTDIEAYLLEVGGYPVMSFVNHGGEAREITFEIDGLLRDGNPLYAWQIVIDAANLPAGELDKEYNDLKAQGKNPEDMPEMREKWRKLKIYQLKKQETPVIDGKNVRLKVAAAPGLLNLATVTTLPVMALSHGNDVVQLPLAGMADVTFSAHRVNGNQHTVTVDSRLGATLGFVVPCGDITLDGSAASLTDDRLEVPPGRHQLNFRIKE